MTQFGYKMKRIVRCPSAMLWALGFPIVLGLLFYLAFGSIEELQQFTTIPVGIVEESANDIFMKIIEEVNTGNSPMFEIIRYDDRAQAEKAMKKEDIQAYIEVDGDDFNLVVKEMDIQTSVIKTFLDQYRQNEELIKNVAVNHPERLLDMITHLNDNAGVEITEIPLKGQDKSPYTQYFYALIAMSCLMACQFGLENGVSIQADQSAVGARRNVSPTTKMRQVITDFLATYLFFCILMAGLLVVLKYAYKQDFGDNIPLVLLAMFVGCFTGLAAGTMIAVISKGNKQKKDSLSSLFFMGSSFLGGLMWGNITDVLERYCPVINRINPATLIVNGFKSLAVFGDYWQYAVNVITLLIIGIIFLGISIVKIRRQKYASL